MDGKIGGWIKTNSYHQNQMRLNTNSCTELTQMCSREGTGKGRWVLGCLGCPCKYSTAHASTVRYQLMPNVDRKPDADWGCLKIGCNWWLPLKDNQKWVAEHLCLTFFSPRFSGLDHGASLGRRQLCQAYTTVPYPYSLLLNRIWFSSQLVNKLLEQGPQYLLNSYLFHHCYHHHYSMDSMYWRSCLPNKLHLSSNTSFQSAQMT